MPPCADAGVGELVESVANLLATRGSCDEVFLIIIPLFVLLACSPTPETPTPAPVPTSIPTSAPIPPSQPFTHGLGVPHSAFLELYEGEMGFSCGRAASILERESVVCRPRDVAPAKEVAVQFAGPLEGIDVAVLVTKDPRVESMFVVNHILRFADVAVPNLPANLDWITLSSGGAIKNGRSVASFENASMVFEWHEASQTLSVVISTQEVAERIASLPLPNLSSTMVVKATPSPSRQPRLLPDRCLLRDRTRRQRPCLSKLDTRSWRSSAVSGYSTRTGHSHRLDAIMR